MGASSQRVKGRRRPSTSTVALGSLVASAACWGSAAALSKVALEQLTPVDLFSIEVGFGGLILGLLALARGARPARPPGSVMALGLLEPGLAFILFDVGVDRTAATHAALLLSTETLLTVGLAAAFLGERLTGRLWGALALGAAGSVLVAWRAGGVQASLLGDALVVAASLAAAGFVVLAGRELEGRDLVAATAAQMLGGVLIAVPLLAAALISGQSHLRSADVGHFAVAGAVALLASVVPFLLFNMAISQVTASTAGLVLTLIPAFGAAASVLLLGESLGLTQLAGGLLIVAAAVTAVTARPRLVPEFDAPARP